MSVIEKIKEFNIPVVDTILPFTKIESLVDFTRGLENAEGFVVAFENGHRVKIKADQYVRIHKCVERIVFDRNIVTLILNEEVDDVLPMLPQVQADRVRDFESRFWEAFRRKESELDILYRIAAHDYENDRKRIALEFVPTLKNKADAQFIFRMLDGHNLRELMLQHIEKHISTNTRWEECAKWLRM